MMVMFFSSAIILNGSNSAFGGFQLSKTNLIAGDRPNKSRLLRLRHDVALQHRSSTSPWVGGDGDTDQELRLDKPVAAYLKQLCVLPLLCSAVIASAYMYMASSCSPPPPPVAQILLECPAVHPDHRSSVFRLDRADAVAALGHVRGRGTASGRNRVDTRLSPHQTGV